MFQKIIETTTNQSKLIHTLENGNLVSGFEIDLIDEELVDVENVESILLNIIKNLPHGIFLRIYLKSTFSNQDSNVHSRTDALKNVGFVKNTAYLVLEKPVRMDVGVLFKKNNQSRSLSEFEFLDQLGLNCRSLSGPEIDDIFPNIGDELNHSFQTIDLGQECLSVVRLLKQTPFGIDTKLLSQVKDTLPLPYLICCNIKKISDGSAETVLRRRSKQNSLGSDFRETRKLEEAQSDLEDISLNGSQLFKFEWQCLVPRSSEEYLRQDRELVKRKLAPLGDVFIESVGALESLKSFYPGGDPHFSLYEKDLALCSYIPIVGRGDSKSKQVVTNRSLALHRKDESLTYLDIFDPTYESYSWCIFGRPGTGKSVITNAITRSLLDDSSVKVIKIDVGGSHSRETEVLGGIEKTLSLNEPTGINPFDILKELGPTKEVIQVLAGFLEVLILEEGEVKLSKSLKAEIERKIQAYAEVFVGIPTLDDFFLKLEVFPRKDLLSRWVGDGVYGNAFKVSLGSTSTDWASSRLLYFNFSKISQALDPDYAQGGLAAVMAYFNFEMLRPREEKQRLVFIADETPFFIKKCFSFFNLSIANVRKEGHGFITVAQKSSHVVIDGDTGILDNSPNKIYFSMDGEVDTFMAKNQLDRESIDKINSLTRVQGEYSEALFKDMHGERILKIRLSSDEYWSYTSKDEDRRKFYELKKACPNLSLQEIVRCLSI